MIKLLLVEDDKNLSYIVQSGLQDIIGGYEVITAFNGKEGLQAWEEHHPDIIISDIDMPVMDSMQVSIQFVWNEGLLYIIVNSDVVSLSHILR